jgi:hypothetical protein
MATEEVFVGEKLNGKRRTWHRNGQLATEECYQDGLLHGVVQQWSAAGRLFGSFVMVHGTGTQKSWHDNGRLNQEFTTVNGSFCGRSRIWLRDGTLISDKILLFGRPVSREKYQRAKLENPGLPKLRGQIAPPPPKNRATQKHIQDVFVRGLLAKRNRSEARKWLKTGRNFACSLGRFKTEHAAFRFVEALYEAGAIKVIVPDIYRNKKEDQFADYLLVKLPKTKAKRAAIRKVCGYLQSRGLAGIEPDRDIGEEYLLVSMA